MSARRAVPWVVVLLGIGLYWWTRRGPGESAFPDVPSDVHVCKENLRAIYAGLREFRNEKGAAPTQPGRAFFEELITSGLWEDTPANRGRLTCPGSGGYAGRDTREHPLAKFPSGGADIQTLIACDNASGLNHEGAMNMLQSDGTVITYQLEELIERLTLPAGTLNIPVGPDSPLESLRVLAPN
jgi:hypothetical protein